MSDMPKYIEEYLPQIKYCIELTSIKCVETALAINSQSEIGLYDGKNRSVTIPEEMFYQGEFIFHTHPPVYCPENYFYRNIIANSFGVLFSNRDIVAGYNKKVKRMAVGMLNNKRVVIRSMDNITYDSFRDYDDAYMHFYDNLRLYEKTPTEAMKSLFYSSIEDDKEVFDRLTPITYEYQW